MTTGSYQYVDANGLLQTVNYVADPVNGFRVAGTNLPVGPAVPAAAPLEAPVFDLPVPVAVEDTPEVAAAKAEFQAAFDEAAAASAERRKREAEEVAVAAAPAIAALPYPYAAGLNLAYAGLPVAAPAVLPAAAAVAHAPLVKSVVETPATVETEVAATPVISYAAAPAIAAPALTYAAAPAIAAPVATTTYAAAAPAIAAAPVAATYAAAAPVVAAAPVAAPASSQYQAQDEFGNVAYGYQNINSAKQESGNALGGVTGSYTYADEAGVHTVNYVADALGFRVAGDNLPVAPVHAAVAPVNTLAPVVDTPEVVEAKAAFFQAYDAAKAGIVKRSAQIALPATYAAAPAIAATYAAAPLAATYAAAPAIAAAPAVAGAYAAAPSRDAVLTTIKLNPGHATFYRVD